MEISDISDTQAASRTDNWTVEYRQIQPGRLTTRTAFSECADVSLLEEQFNRRIEIVGRSPSDCVSIVALINGENHWVNGLTLDTRSVLLIEPGTEIHAVTGEDTHSISMTVLTARLRRIRSDILESGTSRGRGRSILVSLGPKVADILRRLMHKGIHQSRSSSSQVEIASNLAAIVSTLVETRIGYPENSSRIRTDESLRTIKCALEFIEANLSSPIAMDSICKNCAASCSKLERTFRRELAISPTQYILARRLDAVNRALKVPQSGKDTIGRIAMDFGFTHLGRFASDYRKHFGELPSETSRSS